jgi:hypothetical protein
MKLKENQFIIFLDIDGVLNSVDFFKHRRNKDEDRFESDIDPRTIEWLNDFLGEDGLVVVSSTWRLSHTKEQLQTILEKRGFTGKIIGCTVNLNLSYGRGLEIKKWIGDNIDESSDFNRYVIFDDSSDFLLEQQEHFFQTDNWFGVSPNTFYKAKRFLNKITK